MVDLSELDFSGWGVSYSARYAIKPPFEICPADESVLRGEFLDDDVATQPIVMDAVVRSCHFAWLNFGIGSPPISEILRHSGFRRASRPNPVNPF